MNDEDRWMDAPDDGRVEAVAGAALARIDRSHPFRSWRKVHRVAYGPDDASCTEMWCVKLHDIEPAVLHCLSVRDTHDTMVQKFASSFAALLPSE